MNFIVVDKQSNIRSSYGNNIEENLDAQSFQHDFQSEPNKGYNNINRKVYQASNKQIKKFLPPGEYNNNVSDIFNNNLKDSHLFDI